MVPSQKTNNTSIILRTEKDYLSLNTVAKNRIDAYLRFAQRNVPYYSNRLKDQIIDAGALYNLPVTQNSDLSKTPGAFVAERSKIVQVSSTGGTYSDRKLIFRTLNDIKRSITTAELMFSYSGIESRDRIAILQPFDLENISHIALRAFQNMNALSAPLGNLTSGSDLAWFLDHLRLNVIYATPSKISNIAMSVPRQDGSNLKEVLCAGEPITASHREIIRNAFGCEIFGIYGSEETDGIGAECKYHDGYHVLDSDLVMELLDPTTLRPSNSRQGVLAITKLDYSGTVLIRYLLDDIIELYDSKCRCGADTQRIKIVGRRSETIFLYDGMKIPLSSIEHSMERVFGIIPIYQIITENAGGHLLVLIRVKHDGSEITKEKLAEDVERSLIKTKSDLGLMKIEVEFVKSLSSFKTTRRGKLPKIVNELSRSL